MSNWFHRFFNPHCRHCAEERQESKVCPTCEVLRTQLDVVIHHNNKLMDRFLEKPTPEPAKEPVPMSLPRNIPWSVRRQMLEQEDREKAKIMRSAPQPVTTEDLEKELDIASAQREIEH
jgi:hypothetical protein